MYTLCGETNEINRCTFTLVVCTATVKCHYENHTLDMMLVVLTAYKAVLRSSPTELEHNMSITASTNNPVIAGSSLTLNCTATSNHVPLLTWVGPNGPTNVENGIIVSEQINGDMKQTILTFDPLRTSHAGNYTCISIIEDSVSKIVAQHLVIVESESTCTF